MPISASEFFSAIQSKLPQAKLIWDKAPDPFFNERTCSLTAISIADPTKKFTMDMPKGLGSEPLDDVVDDFIEFFLAELRKNDVRVLVWVNLYLLEHAGQDFKSQILFIA